MTIHVLKIHPEYFRASVDGVKPFEIRKNDRDYKVNDLICLREWCPEKEEYTGWYLQVRITYITSFEQKEGYVVMGLTEHGGLGIHHA